MPLTGVQNSVNISSSQGILTRYPHHRGIYLRRSLSSKGILIGLSWNTQTSTNSPRPHKGILIGLSWEKTYELGLEALTHANFFDFPVNANGHRDYELLEQLTFVVALFLLVAPAWMYYAKLIDIM
jgi:hypothetical protein